MGEQGGPRLRGVRLGGSPGSLEALGLDARDGRATVGGVVLAAGGGDRMALDVEGVVDGVLPPCEPVVPAPATEGPHPLGAVAVDHVVVLCGDVEATIDALGVAPRRVEVRSGRRYGFVVARTALLEFVGPEATDDRPPRPWGIGLAVADLDAAVAWLGPACGPPRDAVQPGRRIATVRHEAVGLGAPTVLLSPRG